MLQEDCIFCRIIRGEVPARIQYEDDLLLVFHDIEPVAPVHMLLTPKVHLPALSVARPEHAGLLGHIQLKAAEIAAGLAELSRGYRLVVNCGEWGGQSVSHLHYHLIGGKPLGWSF